MLLSLPFNCLIHSLAQAPLGDVSHCGTLRLGALVAYPVGNVILWTRNWLAASASPLRRYGMLRMVRDVFHISGFLLLDAWGRIRQIMLNHLAPLASVLLAPFQELFAHEHVISSLAQRVMPQHGAPPGMKEGILKPKEARKRTLT